MTGPRAGIETSVESSVADTTVEPSHVGHTRPPRTAVARAVRIGRVLVSLAVVVAIGLAVVRDREAVGETLSSLSWQSVVLAMLAVMIGMFATVRVYQHLLCAVGVDLRYPQVAEITLVGQLGKYLPGSVWSFVLQAELGRRYKVPRARALSAMLLAAGCSVVTALSLSVLAIRPLLQTWGDAAWLLAFGPLSLCAMFPAVLTRIVNTALRLMRRPPLDRPISGAEVIRAVLWSFGSWFLYGIQLWALASSLGRLSVQGYLLATGAFALAMSAGFVAVILPSGVGVREAVIVAGMSPVLPPGVGLAFALTSRLLFTFADLSAALVAVCWSRLHRRGAPDSVARVAGA